MALYKNSEFDMFGLFELTPDLVCLAGKDGFFKKINKAVVDKLKYTEEELFASPISTFIYPEDRALTAEKRLSLIEGSALLNFENRYVAKTGQIIWLHWTSIYLQDKKVVFALAKDVTQKKTIEKETEENYKKFKGLAIHFKNNIEKAKKYFAFELHEELAQLASVIKMDIDGVLNSLPDLTDTAKGRLDNAYAASQLLVDKIRKLSFTISPNTLDDLGLDETIKWLCKDFTKVNNIPCVFKNKYDEDDLTKEVKLDFFRICQESLNNVMQHSQATIVTVTIEDANNEICLSIIDDGKGFEPGNEKSNSGLINIRELASSINGKLNIESNTGKGTKVCVTIEKGNKANM